MLNKLERKLKFDVRYLLSGGFFVLLEHSVSVITGVVFGLLVANILDPNQYGVYKYLLSLAGVVAAFTLTGLSTSLMQSVARGYEGTFKLIAKTQLRWSLPALLVGSVISFYYLWQGAHMMALVLLSVSLLIPLRDLGNLSTAYLSGKELFGVKAVLNGLRTVLGVSILTTILFWTKEAKVLVLTQYAIESLGFLLMLLYVLKKYPTNDQVAKDGVAYGKHLSFIEIIQRVAANIDKLFVFQVFGSVALASYSIALMPVLQLMSGNKILRTLIAPRFAKRSFKEIHATIFYKAALITLASSGIMFIYIISVPIIFKYLLPQYTAVVPMAQLASLLLLASSKSLFGQVLVAHGCKRELYASAIIGNLFLAAGIFFGGWLGGTAGVLVAFVIGQFVHLAIGILAYLYAYRAYFSV